MGRRTWRHRSLMAGAVLAGGAALCVNAANSGALAATSRSARTQAGAVTTLTNDVVPHLTSFRDLGPAPAGQQFQVAITMQHDQTALQSSLAALYDPSSPSYHQWLTPAQFQTEFDASPQRVAAARYFATAHGMSLYNPDGLGDLTLVSGNTSQVEATFSVTIHQFRASDGRVFYANLNGPTVPAGAGIAGVLGLQNLLQFQTSPMGAQDEPGSHPAASNASTAASPATAPTPGQGNCVPNPAGGNAACTGLLGPADLWSAYDQQPYAAGATTNDLGQGQSVGIIGEGQTGDVVSALREFEKSRGLPAVPVQVYWTDNGAKTDDGGRIEWELDSQAITGMAPDISQLRLYFASSLGLSNLAGSLQTWASDPQGPQQVNASLGICEAFPGADALLGPSQTADSFALAQAATEGRTFFSSAGDTGGGCLLLFNPPVTPPGWPPPINGIWYGEFPFASYPAADPNATSVGGTVIYTDGNGGRVDEHAWDHTGGTRSSYIQQPSYQSSVPQLAANLCLSQADGTPYVPPVPCRATADVSALSGDGTIVLNHEANSNAHQGPLPGPNGYPLGNNTIPANGYAMVDDAVDSNGADHFNDNFSEGGTSLASPLWAGMWSRVAAAHTGNIGRANDQIYKVASGSDYANAFNDIVEGANPLPATPGWDFPTGWGSPKLNQLIKDVDNGNTTPVHNVLPGGPDPAPLQSTGPSYGCPATVVGSPTSTVALPGAQPQLSFLHGDLALSSDGKQLQARVTVQNMSQTLPTGFTTEDWLMSWANPNPAGAPSGNVRTYAVEATYDQLAGWTYSDGTLDTSSGGYTYTPVNTNDTGSFKTGPAGYVEIDVPLANIGSPAAGFNMGKGYAATDEAEAVNDGVVNVGITGLIIEQATGASDYHLGDASCITNPPTPNVPEAPLAIALPLMGGVGVAVAGTVTAVRRRRQHGALSD